MGLETEVMYTFYIDTIRVPLHELSTARGQWTSFCILAEALSAKLYLCW